MPYLVRFDAGEHGEGPSYLKEDRDPKDGLYVDDPQLATKYTKRCAEKVAKREDHEWITITTLDEALAIYIMDG